MWAFDYSHTVVLSSLARTTVRCDVSICVNIIEDILSTVVHIRCMKCALNWCGKIPNIISYIFRDTQPWNIIFEVGEFSRRAKKIVLKRPKEQKQPNEQQRRTPRAGRGEWEWKKMAATWWAFIYLFIFHSTIYRKAPSCGIGLGV